MKTDEAPVTGSTCRTFPAPKSRTSRMPLTGLKPNPSMWGLEPAIVTLRTRSPFGLITYSTAFPPIAPVALKPKLGT